MKRLIGSCLLASLALTIHAQPAETGLKIAVHIYNYAGASPETLVRAERGMVGRHLTVHETSPLLLHTAADPAGAGMHVSWQTNHLEQGEQGMPLFLRKMPGSARAQFLARRISAVQAVVHSPRAFTAFLASSADAVEQGSRILTPGKLEKVPRNIRARIAGELVAQRSNHAEEHAEIDLGIGCELEVSVQVYNSAHIAISDLTKAEAEAASMFQKAKIKVTWTEGLISRDVKSPSVSHEAWNPVTLQLRICTRAMVRPIVASEKLGFVISLEESHAVVLFDAIRDLAASRFTDPANLLGLAMAHEMGHLLLQSVAHSAAGIMRAQWLAKDLRVAENGFLMFTREQNHSMRNEVRRRMDQASSEIVPQITVSIYNSAHVPVRDLTRAEAKAANILQTVGVKVTWILDRSVPGKQNPSKNDAWNPSHLQLRLWPRSLVPSRMIGTDTLGFCISMQQGTAVVLPDEARSFAEWMQLSDAANLLGLAMAHEIGHILLGTLTHSGTGIMQARWRPKDLRDSEQGLLFFTQEQGRIMRREVLRRVSQGQRARSPMAEADRGTVKR